MYSDDGIQHVSNACNRDRAARRIDSAGQAACRAAGDNERQKLQKIVPQSGVLDVRASFEAGLDLFAQLIQTKTESLELRSTRLLSATCDHSWRERYAAIDVAPPRDEESSESLPGLYRSKT